MTLENGQPTPRLSDEDAALLGHLMFAQANGELGDPLDPTTFEDPAQWRRVVTPLAEAAGIQLSVVEGRVPISVAKPTADTTEQTKVRGLRRVFLDSGSAEQPVRDGHNSESSPDEQQTTAEQLHAIHVELKKRLSDHPNSLSGDDLSTHERRSWFFEAITQGNEHQDMLRRVFSQLALPQQRQVLSAMIQQYAEYRATKPRGRAVADDKRAQLDELLGLNDCDMVHDIAVIAEEHGLTEGSVKTSLRVSYGLKIAEGFDLDSDFAPLVEEIAELGVRPKKKRLHA